MGDDGRTVLLALSVCVQPMVRSDLASSGVMFTLDTESGFRDAVVINGAVERMIAQAIEAAQRADKKIGICGQAPSDYPEFARFLVERGITSISLTPDTVIQTTGIILNAEARLATGGNGP